MANLIGKDVEEVLARHTKPWIVRLAVWTGLITFVCGCLAMIKVCVSTLTPTAESIHLVIVGAANVRTLIPSWPSLVSYGLMAALVAFLSWRVRRLSRFLTTIDSNLNETSHHSEVIESWITKKLEPRLDRIETQAAHIEGVNEVYKSVTDLSKRISQIEDRELIDLVAKSSMISGGTTGTLSSLYDLFPKTPEK
jgi:hypothetical protein